MTFHHFSIGIRVRWRLVVIVVGNAQSATQIHMVNLMTIGPQAGDQVRQPRKGHIKKVPDQ